MRKHSPLTYVDRVKTPVLVLHARDDRRVPYPLGQAYYQYSACFLRVRKLGHREGIR